MYWWSAQSVGTGGVHSITSKPRDAATTRTVNDLPQPGGPAGGGGGGVTAGGGWVGGWGGGGVDERMGEGEELLGE
jgi:hypothetical protein